MSEHGPEQVKELVFSDKWVVGILQRHGMARRRVTATAKNIPPVAEVQNTMGGIQKEIVVGELKNENIWNADETGDETKKK